MQRFFPSAVPAIIGFFSFQTGPTVLPSGIIQGEATRGTNQNPDYQTPAPPSSQVQQPRPALSLQPDPRGGFHLLSPTTRFLWSPVGGAPMFFHLQQPVGHHRQIYPDTHKRDGTYSNLNLPSFPQISPPRSFIPLISSAFINQLVRNSVDVCC